MNLTILLVTFNHAAFIDKAINSILAQRFGEPVEVLVADDGSTDATREIIASMFLGNELFPVRFLSHDERLGTTKNYKRAFDQCRTEYLAILEGDDYWTRSDKLKKQFRFLQKHPECPACATNFLIYNTKDWSFRPRRPVGTGFDYVDAPALIMDNVIGNFSTCMYRTADLRNIPDRVFEIAAYDWLINICLAKDGPIGLLSAPMSVYRIHGGGLWSGKTRVEQLNLLLDNCDSYDEATGGVFSAHFNTLAQSIEQQLVGTNRSWNRSRVARLILAFVPRLVSWLAAKILYWIVPPAVPIGIRKISLATARKFKKA